MKFYKNVIFDKNQILAIVQDGNETLRQKIRYRPRLFVPTNVPSEYTAFGEKDQYVAPVDFENFFEQFRFIRDYKDGMRIYGNKNNVVDWISQNYETMEYDERLINVCYIDIEVGSESGFPSPRDAMHEVQLITLTKGDQFISLGLGDYTPETEDVRYFKFEDEATLLKAFIKLWVEAKYDVVTGWFIREFDIPYLVRRIERVLGEGASKYLSPWKKVENVQIPIANTEDYIDTFEIAGISTLDYIELVKKHGDKKYENYKLNTVAYVELGEKKLDHSQYKTLHDLYLHDFHLYTAYNIQDVRLVKKLEEKMQLLSLVFNLAYTARVNYVDTFKQTVMWDSIIYNKLKEKKQIPAIRTDKVSKDKKFEGAFVKDPVSVGKHDWMVSLDATSFYPKITIGYNISPETFKGKIPVNFDELLEGNNKNLDLLKTKNLAMGANGAVFDRSYLGVLPEILITMFDERAMYKNKMLELKRNKGDKNLIAKYDILQKVKKIGLNSSFGASGNPGYRYFNIDVAEGITVTAQLGLLIAEKAINKYLNELFGTEDVPYVIYCDTDSVYVKLEQYLVHQKLENAETNDKVDAIDKFSKEVLQPLLDKEFDKMANFTNAHSQQISFKRESIANRGIWTSKKKYILSVLDKEGVKYSPSEIMITGIEAIKSDTPETCREALKRSFRVIMEGTEEDIHKFIRDYKEEFLKLKFEDISFPKSVNGLTEYASPKEIFKKGTPINTRASLMYNHFLKEKGLTKNYQSIKNGEKIRFGYLKMPNPTYQNVIAIKDDLPPEFGLQEYIDYELQFEKAFISPLENIIGKLGWNSKHVDTLEALFV